MVLLAFGHDLACFIPVSFSNLHSFSSRWEIVQQGKNSCSKNKPNEVDWTKPKLNKKGEGEGSENMRFSVNKSQIQSAMIR
mmetsp:Transcript_93/g.145  ORF Transcript_93/g.145 Transcript_93/m.145 type:complete len:81 (+) Transcript_93:2631-2873(+)